MRHSALAVAAVLSLVGVSASPAAAADKAHQQLMAEIRMLQEQQQQLQQMMGGLAETLKMVTTKIDDQTARIERRLPIRSCRSTTSPMAYAYCARRRTTPTFDCRPSRRNWRLCGRRSSTGTSPAAAATPPGQEPGAARSASRALPRPASRPACRRPRQDRRRSFRLSGCTTTRTAITWRPVRHRDPGVQRVHFELPELRQGRRRAAEYRKCAVRRRKVPRGGRRVSESDLELSAERQRGGCLLQDRASPTGIEAARSRAEGIRDRRCRSIRPRYEAILAKQRLDALNSEVVRASERNIVVGQLRHRLAHVLLGGC